MMNESNKELAVMKISDDDLERVCGGITTADVPHYGEIKRCFIEKGEDEARHMAVKYFNWKWACEVIRYIKLEIEKGDLSYPIDGGYYF